ncbi:hypothetical protein BGZ73_002236, partial [Actinomortierella ambigua]
WKNYGPEHNSWEPFDNFDDIQIVRKYWRSQKSRRHPPYIVDKASGSSSSKTAAKKRSKSTVADKADPSPDSSTLRRSK